MKKKLLGILLPVVAGVGLVGATFAAWAVTDNANPLGIKISPTTVAESDVTFSTMVLEWGDTTNFVKIENLQKGVKTYRSVQVKSKVTHTGTDNQVGGKLTVSLEDRTGPHTAGYPLLIDNIKVNVYDSNDYNQDPIIALDGTASTPVLSGSSQVNTNTNGTAKTIYFEVLVPDSVTAVAYNQMSSDVLYLGIDWGKPDSVVPTTILPVYFNKGSMTKPYVYAYKDGSNPIQQNDAFPGEPMTQYNGNYYVYNVNKSAFDTIIFSDTAQGLNQTANIPLSGHSVDKPYWDGDSWEALPSEALVETTYSLVGTFNSWSTTEGNLAMTKGSGNVYSVDLTIPANKTYEFKVVGSDSVWYGPDSTEGGSENGDWGNNTDSSVTITVTFSTAKNLGDNHDKYIWSVVKA